VSHGGTNASQCRKMRLRPRRPQPISGARTARLL
jgi:hypothetical protein